MHSEEELERSKYIKYDMIWYDIGFHPTCYAWNFKIPWKTLSLEDINSLRHAWGLRLCPLSFQPRQEIIATTIRPLGQAERNVLPVLNNLLENREMQLAAGHLLRNLLLLSYCPGWSHIGLIIHVICGCISLVYRSLSSGVNNIL